MKNALFLFLFSFLLVGFSNTTFSQSKESIKRQKFVSKFVGAISVKKKNKIIKKIDKNYVSKQLDKVQKGDKEEFLAEFFKGRILKSGEYSRVPLDKIFDVRLKELNELQAGVAECKLIFQTPEGDVESVFYLKALKKKGKFAFTPRM